MLEIFPIDNGLEIRALANRRQIPFAARTYRQRIGTLVVWLCELAAIDTRHLGLRYLCSGGTWDRQEGENGTCGGRGWPLDGKSWTLKGRIESTSVVILRIYLSKGTKKRIRLHSDERVQGEKWAEFSNYLLCIALCRRYDCTPTVLLAGVIEWCSEIGAFYLSSPVHERLRWKQKKMELFGIWTRPFIRAMAAVLFE